MEEALLLALLLVCLACTIGLLSYDSQDRTAVLLSAAASAVCATLVYQEHIRSVRHPLGCISNDAEGVDWTQAAIVQGKRANLPYFYDRRKWHDLQRLMELYPDYNNPRDWYNASCLRLSEKLKLSGQLLRGALRDEVQEPLDYLEPNPISTFARQTGADDALREHDGDGLGNLKWNGFSAPFMPASNAARSDEWIHDWSEWYEDSIY